MLSRVNFGHRLPCIKLIEPAKSIIIKPEFSKPRKKPSQGIPMAMKQHPMSKKLYAVISFINIVNEIASIKKCYF